MKGRFFQYLIGFAALALAGAAAYFSVFGLSKLFAGASMLVIIMASALEFGKIISVSFIYRYWQKVNAAFKAYFMTGVVALMLITSLGIYGFLSAAYQQTASKDEIQNSEVAIYELKKNRFDEQRTYIMTEKSEIDNSISEIDKSISDLRAGLANNVIQYTDTAGNVLTSTSSTTRRALQEQLKTAQEQRTDALERKDNIGIKLEAVTDSLSVYDRKIFELESSNETSNELGPLKYLAGLLDIPMDKIVNWFILLIIFVFDPMAIALIVAFNYIGMEINEKKKPKNLEKSEEFRKFREIEEETIGKTNETVNEEEKEIESIADGTEDGELPNDDETPETQAEEPKITLEYEDPEEDEKPETEKGYLYKKYKQFFPDKKVVDKKGKKTQVKKEINFPGMQPNGSINIK